MKPRIYSVSRVNSYIRGMFEDDGLLGHIWVQGEASNVSYHKASGHIYFTIKDEKSQLLCTMFSNKRDGLDFRLVNGQDIQVHGSIGVFERDGKYQLYADKIKLAGQGELYEKFLELKNKLEEEGLFSQMYKKKLPLLIKRLGVVTAEGGKGLQDIIKVALRRNPFIQIVLYPAKVQGEGAALTIAEGIRRIAMESVDAVIVGRGGGSIEEMWAFNEEVVARAIFDCPVPVISAVGHTTDISISDFVADVHAQTPSVAAEIAVVNISEIFAAISEYENKLRNRMRQKTETERNRLYACKLMLMKKSPHSRIEIRKQELNTLKEKLTSAMEYAFRSKRQEIGDLEGKLMSLMKYKTEKKRHELELYIEKLKALSPLYKLSKGYTYVSDDTGKSVSSVKQLKKDGHISLQFADGSAGAVVENIAYKNILN